MCGCNNLTVGQMGEPVHRRKELDTLSGKNIKDINGNVLLVTAPIHDVYGDIIGYITKTQEGNTMRIFAKNVAQII
jgi:hypothetical protein